MCNYKTTACIDFGTSNSGASIVDEKCEIIPIKLEGNNLLLPSAMFFYHNSDDRSDKKNGKVFFGHQAEIENMINHENGKFVRSFKSLLGSNLDLFKDTIAIYDERFPFVNILAVFLSRLKLLIDIAAGQDVKSVVFGRPVHFNDDDIEKDKYAELTLTEIAKFVGFETIDFLEEPVAAAYYHKHNKQCNKNTNALIIDIGGGTSDFSVVDFHDNHVFANTGVHIGGNDFDEMFASKDFMPLYGKGGKYYSGLTGRKVPFPTSYYDNLSKWIKINDVHYLENKEYGNLMGIIQKSCEPEKAKYLKEIIDNKLGFVNLSKIEETKKSLSATDSVDVCLDFLSDKPRISITRKDFENAISEKVRKIMESISDCLNKSGKTENDIDFVVFTGGSSQIPHIRQKIKDRFTKAQFLTNDCMTSVCTGLAYYEISKRQKDTIFTRTKIS